ncbi:uncharacterized protein LOC124336716 [Daphnia pulicaria]|uniref:uncharacterized protein LOC124336716 n=1 Tax=Daphnia pulicaria TaxID=35523 RepID=UPI001EEA4F8D|nr:uncharacterized protein LOC124336716 [Daphnia pulicaria]
MPSSIGNDERSASSIIIKSDSGAGMTNCSVRHPTMPLLRRRIVGLIIIITTLFNAAVGTIATTDNVVAAHTKPPSHPFMNVETSCSGDSLLIMASLQEPFFGLIYANGFATSPSCRAEGTGSRLLRLALNSSECGIHFIQSEDGSRQLELSLYLQYDYHVQQAVDEKMTTRCRLQTSEKSSTESPVTQPPSSLQQRHSAIFSLLEKSGRRNEAGPPATTIKNALLPFRPLMNNSLTPTTSSPGKLSGLPLTSYQAKKLEMNRDSSKTPSASPSMVLSGALKLLPAPKQRDQITCWMDIVAGTDPTGNPVEGYLRVGQEATVVVRVRQTVGLDTRLTSCVAHDGSHESQQELLDSDGCSLDTSILPNVQERIINRSGSIIKLLYANFQAFRFPDRDHLHLKCTVVVCKGKCLMNPCNLIRRKGRATNSSKVTEGKGFGQLGSIRQLSAQEMSEAATRPSRGRNSDRSLSTFTDSKSRLRSGSLRSSNLTLAINSIPNYGAIIDKVDVFNSVEIRVATSTKNTDDAIRGYTSKSISDEDFSDGSSEEAIFCLTPSKLFMAFGILFAVLISAMLFAVCVCIRIKTSKNNQKNQQQQQQQQQRHNPYSASSPPRFLSSSPCPPTQAYNPACMRHPGSFNSRHQLQLNFNRHQNSAAPYMRVFK